MKTTLQINDELLRRAKIRAAETEMTLTALIETALRSWLSQDPTPRRKRQVKIPTGGSGGLLPGVDLDSTALLLDRMEREQ